MRPALFALLFPVAALAGCAGTTLRPADSDDTGTGGVAIAPTPEPAPTPEAAPAPLPPSDSQPPAALANDTAANVSQGYAPYGETMDLEVRRIGQWSHTSISEARRLIIRDANAWAQLWSELAAGERPDVDFTQNIVVAVAAGQRASGGHEIAISRVTNNGGQLTIEVLETTPGPNCVTAGGATQPVDVVVVPAAAPRSWSFLERKEIRSCR
jgi:hypothetical protein